MMLPLFSEAHHEARQLSTSMETSDEDVKWREAGGIA
tara:strand:+ start:924 stop:1034 length:111 start_codon:yes stop_codon:yes gene_type:complete